MMTGKMTSGSRSIVTSFSANFLEKKRGIIDRKRGTIKGRSKDEEDTVQRCIPAE